MQEFNMYIEYEDEWRAREGIAADWRDDVHRKGRAHRTPRLGNSDTAKEARFRLDWALKELAADDRLHYVSSHGYDKNLGAQRAAWVDADIRKEMQDLRDKWHGMTHEGTPKPLRDHEWAELRQRIEGEKLEYVPFHKVVDKPSSEAAQKEKELTSAPYTALRWAAVACGGFELRAEVHQGAGGTRIGAMGRDEMREKVDRFLRSAAEDGTTKEYKWEDKVSLIFLTALLRKDRIQS